ncbi:dipeptide epimerase [Lacticaseibacillus casei]|uniref:Dipeptide epimerase n=1 Tax=Lacticaseibacillus huelsenbergensis TaxID=3035291 RepID=A0ABY8DM75_9LACO|nr:MULTISPECIES: dipeptide epimerase [Lacticaseibacillus]MDG3061321.1 dipeptide epimerase [Lacticaseibacillus sp. BCRC 81376]QVI38654.1 dipeptide epimerase [Lacticaseibacillus casei]WFB38065.1 dipeptide epimerase [Lacticaseibacillus huelsenbergensis]WFB42468.1 dipeptide epimerase [Lacticaseibacillus huelsenbergensis]
MVQIKKIQVFRRPITLHEPFKVAFTTLYKLETLIIKITTDTGLIGYGETNPLEQVTGESIDTEEVALKTLSQALSASDPRSLEAIHAKMDACFAGHTAAKAGIDMACWDLLGKDTGLPVYQLLGGTGNVLTSDCTIGINSPEKMAQEAKRLVDQGYRELKVKVGIQDADDLAAVQTIRKAVGPTVDLRLDANQGWNPKQAVRMMRAIGGAASAVEQPLPANRLDQMPAVCRQIDQLVMLDESVHNASDAFAAVRSNACDIINIKLQKSAGLSGAEQINAVAEAAGIPCMVGCMAETRIGIAAAAHFVAAHQNVQYADLDSFLLFDEPAWLRGGFTADAGKYQLSDKPGLGIECDL